MKILEKYLEDQNFQPGILQKFYILQESLRIPGGENNVLVCRVCTVTEYLQCKMSTKSNERGCLIYVEILYFLQLSKDFK